jgi:hypothetical protein
VTNRGASRSKVPTPRLSTVSPPGLSLPFFCNVEVKIKIKRKRKEKRKKYKSNTQAQEKIKD